MTGTGHAADAARDHPLSSIDFCSWCSSFTLFFLWPTIRISSIHPQEIAEKKAAAAESAARAAAGRAAEDVAWERATQEVLRKRELADFQAAAAAKSNEAQQLHSAELERLRRELEEERRRADGESAMVAAAVAKALEESEPDDATSALASECQSVRRRPELAEVGCLDWFF